MKHGIDVVVDGLPHGFRQPVESQEPEGDDGESGDEDADVFHASVYPMDDEHISQIPALKIISRRASSSTTECYTASSAGY